MGIFGKATIFVYVTGTPTRSSASRIAAAAVSWHSLNDSLAEEDPHVVSLADSFLCSSVKLPSTKVSRCTGIFPVTSNVVFTAVGETFLKEKKINKMKC